MLTNSGSRLILRTQEPDASTYARLYAASMITANDIAAQDADEHQYAVLHCDSERMGLFSMIVLPWPAPLPVVVEEEVEGVVAEPPQVSRHPDLPAIQLAGTILKVAFARPLDFPGVAATIDEIVDVNVAIPTSHRTAEALFQAGNRVQRLAAHGIAITTLVEEQRHNPAYVHHLHELQNAVAPDWPDPERVPFTPVTFDDFARRLEHATHAQPDAFFIAQAGSRYIGYCGLSALGTAVHPDYRNQGVATAIPARTTPTVCPGYRRHGHWWRDWPYQCHPRMAGNHDTVGRRCPP